MRIVLLYHSLAKSRNLALNSNRLPFEEMIIEEFKRVIESFLEKGYSFPHPSDFLTAKGPAALITFDDGYFNNSYALPVLESLQVPAVFFVTTSQLQQPRKYWWDVAHKAFRQKGFSDRISKEEIERLKLKGSKAAEQQLLAELGSSAFNPSSDEDRPFTASELLDFCASPYVHLGCHTHNHELLTSLSRTEIIEEVNISRQILSSIHPGTLPFIAYPNGNASAEVASAVRTAGIEAGFVTVGRWHMQDGEGLDPMFLPRVSTFGGVGFEAHLKYILDPRRVNQLNWYTRRRLGLAFRGSVLPTPETVYAPAYPSPHYV